MIEKIKNIVSQLIGPKRGGVIAKKVLKRFFDSKGSLAQEQNLEWIKQNSISIEELCIGINKELWEESIKVSENIEEYAQCVMKDLDVALGGGGAYPFLYFITRLLKPNCIVETGVATGMSSSAFLEGLNANGSGRLYSSDFPYFRLANPEKYIGIVVKENVKKYWTLLIEGDENNLPQILNKVDSIDIFHYDSDKSYNGRENAISLISKKMHKDAIILFDDIQDNSHFYDYIKANKIVEWKVFEFDKKYVGMIGEI